MTNIGSLRDSKTIEIENDNASSFAVTASERIFQGCFYGLTRAILEGVDSNVF